MRTKGRPQRLPLRAACFYPFWMLGSAQAVTNAQTDEAFRRRRV